MTDRYAQMLNVITAIYLGRRQHVERAERGEFKRPEPWFFEQNGRLDWLKEIGLELRLIANNASSYEAWRASVSKENAA